MPVKLAELVACSDQLLQPQLFNDYCPNGLQVQGKAEVSRLVSGVTASQALIDHAIAGGADAMLVHHGFFWKGEDPCITGMKYSRLKGLLNNGISLIAYHLPLDAHPQYGNNAQLAKLLEIEISGGLEPGNANSVGNIGRLPVSVTADTFRQLVSDRLGREALLIPGGDHAIKTVGLCTGGAQGYIGQAAAQGVDAYLSGEISEPTVHEARELGVHYIAAGHHATERYGVQAVGEYLAQMFSLDHQFIDIDNPA
jgi:dinuclear metal center YbgI/SA1388 family protein